MIQFSLIAGLFLGFAYLAASFTVMAIYYISSEADEDNAIIFYAVTELVQVNTLSADTSVIFLLLKRKFKKICTEDAIG